MDTFFGYVWAFSPLIILGLFWYGFYKLVKALIDYLNRH